LQVSVQDPDNGGKGASPDEGSGKGGDERVGGGPGLLLPRGPQSTQSVPSVQEVNSAPGPPSSQSPSLL